MLGGHLDTHLFGLLDFASIVDVPPSTLGRSAVDLLLLFLLPSGPLCNSSGSTGNTVDLGLVARPYASLLGKMSI